MLISDVWKKWKTTTPERRASVLLLGIIGFCSLVFCLTLLKAPLDDADFWLKVLSAVLGTLFFAVGVAALVTNHFVADALQKRVAAQTLEIETARRETAEVTRETVNLSRENLQIRSNLAGLDIELANARRSQAEEERETLRLKERIRPRNLEPAQREKLLNRLRDSPTKGAVLMHFQLGDGEGAEFALQLRDVLEEAGWEPSPVSAIPYVRMYDLHVWTQNDLRPPHRANMLRGALMDADLPTRETTYSAMQADDVALVVGFKSPYR